LSVQYRKLCMVARIAARPHGREGWGGGDPTQITNKRAVPFSKKEIYKPLIGSIVAHALCVVWCGVVWCGVVWCGVV
jgi:hypothetical protein